MAWILRFVPLSLLMVLAGLACFAGAGAWAHYEWQKSLAREADLPPPVAAGALGEVRGFPWYEEVAVTAQIDEDLTYVYWVDYTDGTVEYPILFFFDPAEQGPVREVLGAIAFDSYDEAAMMTYLESAVQGEGAFGPIFELAGAPPILPSVTYEEIVWAAEDLGVAMSENFLYLDPYFDGRENRLEARPELTYIAGLAGIALMWLGLIVQIVRRRFRNAEAERKAMGLAARRGLVAAGSAGLAALLGDGEDDGYI
ncbi:MAG: hypothetical protein QNJ13_14045 [Paracoccaceae bacterium]|nr:hypothetical protein [Paracoccaceae bacterium]